MILRLFGHVQDVGLINLGSTSYTVTYQANAVQQSLTSGEVHLGKEHTLDMAGNQLLIQKPVLRKHSHWIVRT